MANTGKRVAPTLRDITPRSVQGVIDALNTRLVAVEKTNTNLQGQITFLQERVRKLEAAP